MTRRRRRLFLIVLAAGLAVLAVAAGLLWPRPSAITEVNYANIRVGMTLVEVETILGGPAGHRGFHGGDIVQTRDDIDVSQVAKCSYLQWIDSHHMIGVQFDARDPVVG